MYVLTYSDGHEARTSDVNTAVAALILGAVVTTLTVADTYPNGGAA